MMPPGVFRVENIDHDARFANEKTGTKAEL